MAFLGQTAGVDIALPNAREILTCDAGVIAGDWVYIDSGGIAQKASATTDVASRVIGIIDSKINATSGFVRFSGRTLYVFAGLDPTKDYFLSATTPGTMTTTVPATGSGHWVVNLGKPISPTKFVVKILLAIKRAS